METPIQVEVTSVGADTAPLSAFTPLQGELKKLTAPNYEALKKEILARGFSFPINAYRDHDGKTLYVLDGHQRLAALKKMQEEGIEIPPLPYSIVQAKDLNEAKIKLLAAASQYGEVNEIGLAQFLRGVEIDPIEFAAQFPLPDVDLPKFMEVHFPAPEEIAPADTDISSAAPMPRSQVRIAGAASSGPVSHVKMVQMFFNEASFPEFMQLAAKFQQHYKKENLSDAMMEVLRAHDSTLFSNPE